VNAWLPRYQPQPFARLRLFCFPNAGGGAAVWRGWSGTLGPEVEVLPVRLPGREERLSEPLHHRLTELVDDLLSGLSPWLDAPFALLGHSMGAHVSFELARALRRHGLRQPRALVLSGSQAPHLHRFWKPMHALPEAEFRQELRRYDGTPEAVLNHPELMELFGPILRADFELVETHPYVAEEPLSVPILALGGKKDPLAPMEGVEQWSQHTRGPCVCRFYDGGHFFLAPHREAVQREVKAFLQPLIQEPT